MKKTVSLTYTENGSEKTFTFTYTPKAIVPRVEHRGGHDVNIAGFSTFTTLRYTYRVEIRTFVTKEEVATLYAIASLDAGLVTYSVCAGDVFPGRDDTRSLTGALFLRSVIPPQKPSQTLYRVTLEFVER